MAAEELKTLAVGVANAVQVDKADSTAARAAQVAKNARTSAIILNLMAQLTTQSKQITQILEKLNLPANNFTNLPTQERST